MTVKVWVEYEPRTIRAVSIECPYCKRKFTGYALTQNSLETDIDLNFAEFQCPVCGEYFGYVNGKSDQLEIKETDCEEVCKGCYQKKEVWVIDEGGSL